MKYNIVCKEDERSHKLRDVLINKLNGINMTLDEDNPYIIFTIGGDGTVLHAVHSYLHMIDDVVFIGIHTGRLGFYTDFLPEEIDELIDLIQGEIKTVKYPLLDVAICGDWGCRKFSTLNDMTLINAYHTQHIDVYINDEYFESFRGTGLCISTPTGSTAYNKSLGGAIVTPLIPVMQITEIGSINSNVYRTIGESLILCSQDVVTFRSQDFNKVTITTDHLHQMVNGYDYIKCKLSTKNAKFAQLKDLSFWNRVRKSFL